MPLLQVTVRPVSAVPPASRGVAVPVAVPPTGMLDGDSDTLTVATGTSVTVRDAVPDRPSLVAVITVLPGAAAVTTPAPDTLATAGFELLHATVRPVSGLLLMSRSAADALRVAPTKAVDAPRETVTVFTGANVTVTVAVPLTPAADAVMVALPGPVPVTTPVALTVATAGLELSQVTGRPASGWPMESRTTAVACPDAATKRLGTASCTEIERAGTSDTETVAEPVRPSLVAEIVAVPGAMAATAPVLLTDATLLSDDDQATARPVSASFSGPRTVAAALVFSPTSSAERPSATVTDTTGTGETVSVADAETPSTVARMLAVPMPSAETTPVAPTVATEGLLLLHDTVRPVSTSPPWLRATTLATVVCRGMSALASSVTTSEATGMSST